MQKTIYVTSLMNSKIKMTTKVKNFHYLIKEREEFSCRELIAQVSGFFE